MEPYRSPYLVFIHTFCHLLPPFGLSSCFFWINTATRCQCRSASTGHYNVSLPNSCLLGINPGRMRRVDLRSGQMPLLWIVVTIEQNPSTRVVLIWWCDVPRLCRIVRQSSMGLENYCYCHLGRLNGKVMTNKICVLGNRKRGAQINDIIMSLWIISIKELTILLSALPDWRFR